MMLHAQTICSSTSGIDNQEQQKRIPEKIAELVNKYENRKSRYSNKLK